VGIKEHLDEAEKTYWAHLKHAFRQSNKLIVAAIKSYIHGIFPNLYKADGPLTVIKIYREIRKIRHIQKLDKALK
jgi:hypothetical protein